MTWPWIVALGAGATVLAALAYWLLIIAEGTYLGPRVVAWTYDLVSHRYDAIKRFQPWAENWFVAAPVLVELETVEQPLILDVATGTGRMPEALLRNGFQGQIVGLDLSRGMLRRAREKLADSGDQMSYVWQDASTLPFDDGAFDAVTCLESLEFMPRPPEALAEMVRVLAPGGLLFLTNRVGHEARLLPGRAIPRQQLGQVLDGYPLRDVEVRRWQVDYDLVLAHKVGHLGAQGRRDVDLVSLLRCPTCRGGMRRGAGGLHCTECDRSYPVRDGLVLMATS
jgi:ubiquinone/menaquinone biosynthesis C-methylase UbiE